jgi:hypothetical protein
MCEYLGKERGAKQERREMKMARRAERKRRIQQRVEERMAKKKMASNKVVKKKDLKKVKKGKGGARHKTGKKWHLPEKPFVEKGSLLAKVIAQFKDADDHVIGENDLIAALEKAGVKPQGKKTVKKLVKAVIRNLSRSGVIVKDRGRAKEEVEDDEEETDDEESSEEESESEDADEDESEDADEDADEEKVETAKPKKKVIKKKTAKK